MRSDDLERAFFFGERGAMECVRNDDVVFKNDRIEFGERKNHAIVVTGFGDDVSCHGGAAKVFAVGHAGFAQNFFE
jgi:hypothetical protein